MKKMLPQKIVQTEFNGVRLVTDWGKTLDRLKTGLASILSLATIGIFVANTSSDNLTQYVPNTFKNFGNTTYVADHFIAERKKWIEDASEKFNVPPELIAATIKNENVARKKYEDWKDFIGIKYGEALDITPSIGLTQVRLDTAQGLDKYFYGHSFSRAETIERLLRPETEIEYTAMFYARELKAMNEYASNDILTNPKLIAELGARYTGGRFHKSLDAELAGLDLLINLADYGTFDPFLRSNVDRSKVRDNANKYLSRVKEGVRINLQ